MNRSELVVKECEILSGIVGRLSSHGHGTKQLAVTAWMAAMGLGWQQRLPSLHLLAVFGGLMFWWLDAFFLAAERKFRRRYQTITTALAADHIDPRVSDPLSLQAKAGFWMIVCAALSSTVWVLYAPLVAFGAWEWFRGVR